MAETAAPAAPAASASTAAPAAPAAAAPAALAPAAAAPAVPASGADAPGQEASSPPAAAPGAPAAATPAGAAPAAAAPAAKASAAEPAGPAAPAAPAAAAPATTAPAAAAPASSAPPASAPAAPPAAAKPGPPKRLELTDESTPGYGDKDKGDGKRPPKPGKKRMTVLEAFTTPSFLFKLCIIGGIFVIVVGLALVSDGYHLQSLASTKTGLDLVDMNEVAYSRVSNGYVTVALGITWVISVHFMQYLLTNVRFPWQKGE